MTDLPSLSWQIRRPCFDFIDDSVLLEKQQTEMLISTRTAKLHLRIYVCNGETSFSGIYVYMCTS